MTSIIPARSGFPWGTLWVNIIGSLLIGWIAALPESRLPPPHRLFLTVGVMGGFTTFSAFSLQVVSLLQSGKILLASAYIGASLAACITGCWGGWLLAQGK